MTRIGARHGDRTSAGCAGRGERRRAPVAVGVIAAGTSTAHRSNAWRHRGANGQPAGIASSCGGVPGDRPQRAVRAAPRRGTLAGERSCTGGGDVGTGGRPAPARPVGRRRSRQPVTDLRHHPEVMGDDDRAHLELRGQPGQQLQDLGLDHHIERGGGLVGDDESAAGRREPGRSSLAGACRRCTCAGTPPPAGPRCRPARAARRRARVSKLGAYRAARGCGSPRRPGGRRGGPG